MKYDEKNYKMNNKTKIISSIRYYLGNYFTKYSIIILFLIKLFNFINS
jgi:hypothetical protein